MAQHKYILQEKDMPTHWYNIMADMKVPPPPYRHPGTLELMGPDDLAPVFPLALIEQEVSIHDGTMILGHVDAGPQFRTCFRRHRENDGVVGPDPQPPLGKMQRRCPAFGPPETP